MLIYAYKIAIASWVTLQPILYKMMTSAVDATNDHREPTPERIKSHLSRPQPPRVLVKKNKMPQINTKLT